MLHSVENAGPRAAPPARGGPAADAVPDLADPREAPRDAEGWAHVLAGWEDEARHRAYLARCTDLDLLATAGRRYREVLLARPGDPVAARQRDEVVRRAVALGLAALPRTDPAARRSRVALRAASIAALAALAAAALLALRALAPYLGAAP